MTRRRRAEKALVTVVAICYLLEVCTRGMDKLVRSASAPKSSGPSPTPIR